MECRRRGETPGSIRCGHTRHVDPQWELGSWFRERSSSRLCRLEVRPVWARISGGVQVGTLAHEVLFHMKRARRRPQGSVYD